MQAVEMLQASGHPEIRANHRTTLEITKDKRVTPKGDCIVAICASKGAADLSPELLRLLKNDSTRVTITIRAAARTATVTGRGDRRLTLTHPSDLVARKSKYICNRTVMVEADKSASDLSREFVRTLRDPSSEITVQLAAEL